MNFLVYADGLCSNNGVYGKARTQGSFAVYALNRREYSERLHQDLLKERSICFESRFEIVAANPTNNVAEAKTLSTALMWCLKSGLLTKGNIVHVCMDSRLVLEQFSGVSQTRDRQLLGVYRDIYDVFDRYKKENGYNPEESIHLHWIPGTTMKESIIAH